MKKKPSNLSRLLGYAEGHRFLLYASWVLSAGSALLALCPFGTSGRFWRRCWPWPHTLPKPSTW